MRPRGHDVAPAAAARLVLLPRPRRTLTRAALRAALVRSRGIGGLLAGQAMVAVALFVAEAEHVVGLYYGRR